MDFIAVRMLFADWEHLLPVKFEQFWLLLNFRFGSLAVDFEVVEQVYDQLLLGVKIG